MKTTQIGHISLPSSRLVYGCMRINGDNSADAFKQGKNAIRAAIDAGYNHFDHADIYGGGVCESIFGEVIKESPELREQLIVTSKAGIRFANTPNEGDVGRYDFSKQYIIGQVEGSLQRLNVDALDLFLLHRPDYLFDPQEVAETFEQLKRQGKVKHFGVSNFSPSQLNLLQSFTSEKLAVNQVEINIHNIDAFSNGTLDQCLQNNITPMAWCPIATVVYEAWGNTFSQQDVERIHQEFDRQAQIYGVEKWLIAFAWLLKHPAKICPIVGTTNPERIKAATSALEINYSREDWYRLLQARNGQPVP
ncbi:aldo/keto reductase family oxidoreductase [Thalassomonas sp. M1454]|uniref:aldo/keto reductase n=1 Tax=Thalassomonas sp. M1454 TaxID=2594477 RepID=UPI001180ED91|nr:aldo/keto reductase [Thalassomonas sp. M1454]TRX58068.1 aldo/keto reductase [Thalassomonas sp. M1454]